MKEKTVIGASRLALLDELGARIPALLACRADMEAAFLLLRGCFSGGGKLLVCGNGGSAADADHVVGELMKGFRLPRPLPARDAERLTQAFPREGGDLGGGLQGALPTISLVGQSALISAFANDKDPDMVFAQQTYGYGRRGDALLGISTSGNSRNVLNALRVARAFGLGTIGLSGREGGAMRDLCDVLIRAPEDETARAQELHLPIYHALCAMLELEFFAG